jgi:RNA polymerase sigma-70 factor, ECF subfamily
MYASLVAPTGAASASVDDAEGARRSRFRKMAVNHFSDIWRSLRHFGVAAHGIDDVAQDVFLIAWQRLDEIRIGSERAFLFSTASLTARAFRRRGHRETPEETLDGALDRSPTPEAQLVDKEASDLARRLLVGLDEELREVFVMYEIGGLTMQRIAELTESPPGTVASRLRRAREIILARFDRHMRRGGQWESGGPWTTKIAR